MSVVKKILGKGEGDWQGTLQESAVTLCNGVHQQLEQILSDPLLAEMPGRNALNLLFSREKRDKTKLLGMVPIDDAGKANELVSQQGVLKRLREINGFVDDLRTSIDEETNAIFRATVDEYATLQERGIREPTAEIKAAIKDYNTLSTDRGCLANVTGMLRELHKGIEELNPGMFAAKPKQMELL